MSTLTFILICAAVYITVAEPSVAKHKAQNIKLKSDKTNTVHLVLKDKEDKKFKENVHKLIGKVKTVIGRNNILRRDGNHGKFDKFTDFIRHVIEALNKYDDTDLELFFVTFNDEVRQYHSKGCKLIELTKSNAHKKFIANVLDAFNNKPPSVIRSNLRTIADKIKRNKLNKNEKKLADFMNSLYRQSSVEKFSKFLSEIESYRLENKDNMNLTTIVKDGVKTIIIDHFDELQHNARRAFKFILDEFWGDFMDFSQVLGKYVEEATPPRSSLKTVTQTKTKRRTTTEQTTTDNHLDVRKGSQTYEYTTTKTTRRQKTTKKRTQKTTKTKTTKRVKTTTRTRKTKSTSKRTTRFITTRKTTKSKIFKEKPFKQLYYESLLDLKFDKDFYQPSSKAKDSSLMTLFPEVYISPRASPKTKRYSGTPKRGTKAYWVEEVNESNMVEGVDGIQARAVDMEVMSEDLEEIETEKMMYTPTKMLKADVYKYGVEYNNPKRHLKGPPLYLKRPEFEYKRPESQSKDSDERPTTRHKKHRHVKQRHSTFTRSLYLTELPPNIRYRRTFRKKPVYYIKRSSSEGLTDARRPNSYRKSGKNVADKTGISEVVLERIQQLENELNAVKTQIKNDTEVIEGLNTKVRDAQNKLNEFYNIKTIFGRRQESFPKDRIDDNNQTSIQFSETEKNNTMNALDGKTTKGASDETKSRNYTEDKTILKPVSDKNPWKAVIKENGDVATNKNNKTLRLSAARANSSENRAQFNFNYYETTTSFINTKQNNFHKTNTENNNNSFINARHLSNKKEDFIEPKPTKDTNNTTFKSKSKPNYQRRYSIKANDVTTKATTENPKPTEPNIDPKEADIKINKNELNPEENKSDNITIETTSATQTTLSPTFTANLAPTLASKQIDSTNKMKGKLNTNAFIWDSKDRTTTTPTTTMAPFIRGVEEDENL